MNPDSIQPHLRPGRGEWMLCLVLILVAVGRIAATCPVLSQTNDEPIHIACGLEWLTEGRYTGELLHPPLARVAAALGRYLSGTEATQASGSCSQLVEIGNNALHGNDRSATRSD